LRRLHRTEKPWRVNQQRRSDKRPRFRLLTIKQNEIKYSIEIIGPSGGYFGHRAGVTGYWLLVAQLYEAGDGQGRERVRQRSSTENCSPARRQFFRLASKPTGAHEFPGIGAAGIYERHCADGIACRRD